MDRIVFETLGDFQGKDKEINEENFMQRAKEAVSGAIKKIGNFFVSTFAGLAAMLPTNIGIMFREGVLPEPVTYIPNAADIELEPELGDLTPEIMIAKREEEEAKELAARGPINESYNKNKALMEDTGQPVPLKHPDANIENVSMQELQMMLEIAMNNPQSPPLMVWGAPGIGKTGIVNSLIKARDKGERIIDVQTAKMAPDDWMLPAIYNKLTGESKAQAGGAEEDIEWVATDIPKSWLPVYKPAGNAEEDKQRNDAANEGAGGVIFLDELSRANEAVQNTCLKLVHERKIGDSILGDKWVIISASNRADDDPDSVQSFSTALGNRFDQVNYVPTFDQWKDWAINHIDSRIIDFLEFNQKYFYTLTTGGDEPASVYASPRSWEAASMGMANLLQWAKENKTEPTMKQYQQFVGRAVGKDIATEFTAFLRLLESYTKEQIQEVLTNPTKARLPRKAGKGFDLAETNALINIIISSTKGKTLTPEEFANFSTYLTRLDNASAASAGIKKVFAAHPYMHDEIGEKPGRDKYLKGYEIFVEKYEDVF